MYSYWKISGFVLFFFAILPVLQSNTGMLPLQDTIDVEEYVFSCVTGDALDSIWKDYIVDNSLQKKICSPLFQYCSEAPRTEFLACRVNDMDIPVFNSGELPETSMFSDHILFFGIHTIPFLKNQYNTIFVTDTLRIGIKKTDSAAFHSNADGLFLDLLPSFEKWEKPGKFTLFMFIVLIALLLVWMTKE